MTRRIITAISTLIISVLFVQSSIAQNHRNHHNQNHEAEEQERFDDVPEAFRATLTEAVEIYITGKDAFLESNLNASVAEFETFTNKLEAIGEHGLTGDGHMAWMQSYSQLQEHVSALTAANNIEDARKAFRQLSEELAITVKKFGVDGILYHQYCPMAIDSDGATWLSSQEQIQNPYTPETMIGCGEMIEKIER